MSRPDDGNGGGFLGRWARLKQETQRAPATPEPPEPPAALDAPLETGKPEEPAAELPLPSLDSIAPGGDVSAFFQAHVPDALRTAALRKLWTTDPQISGFIEMADYQWDFNNPDAIPGWGSKLDTTDIRRLAERLLGGDEAGARTPDAAALVENAQHPEFPAKVARLETPGSVADEIEQEMQAVSSEAGPVNDAVQKIPSESAIYPLPKKRHGSALPS